jgi:probable LLM family oxidoreductase
MELGLYTFGDIGRDPASGDKIDAEQRLKNLVEEIELADQVGLDLFGLGEHHRPDYAVSAPAIVLAAAAPRTKNIKLSSAVTVLSSDDPIRVYQQYTTLDLISGGRAEVMAGRGSFIESFPLFGHDLNEYDALFAEKLAMLLQLRENEKIEWPGTAHTPRIDGRGVYPRSPRKLPVWIAVGGTPQSVARAGALGLPLALAIIGGEPARFAPFFKLYRDSAAQAGHDPAKLPTSINVHGYVGETLDEADEAFYLAQKEVMDRIGRERGWGPSSRAQYDAAVSPRGNLFLGDPQMVIDKILANHEIFCFDRFVLQMAIGVIPHKKMLKAIELYGTKVAPAVRKAVSPAS